MTKRNCQNCEQVIGNLEESYTYYGHVVCKGCMVRLEKQSQYLGTTNDDISTEIPIAEERIQQNQVAGAEQNKEGLGDKQLNDLGPIPAITQKEIPEDYEADKEPDTMSVKLESPEQSDYSSSRPTFFSYDGRINRAKYILTMFLLGFLGYLVISIWTIISPESSFVGNILLVIFCSFPIVKRWHDMNKSGVNYFWGLVPIANLIAVLFLLFSKGTAGSNQYGPDPLAGESTNPNQEQDQDAAITAVLATHDIIRGQCRKCGTTEYYIKTNKYSCPK